MIRPATAVDASRIAEILIFSKRVNYREIFHNDMVSFGEMQVYPLAKDYIDQPDTLNGIWVYDDEFVKGMIHIEGNQIAELYVDPFFEGQGIGSALIEFAIEQKDCDRLWVLEKNTKAIRFYQKHGFSFTSEKQLQDGTPEFIVKMRRE
jgi:putative acetyltransferase